MHALALGDVACVKRVAHTYIIIILKLVHVTIYKVEAIRNWPPYVIKIPAQQQAQ
jgi:hypothetical protein